MDSGIDSTESSNQSVGEGPVTLFVGVEPTVGLEVDSASESSNNIAIRNGEAFTPANTPNRASGAVDMAAPNSLRSLAAAVAGSKASVDDEVKEKTVKSSKEKESIIQHGLEQMNKMPQIRVPEGRVLHFNLSPLEGRTSGCDDAEPPAGLSFSHISPTMCLSSGYEAYGYAVTPYENHDLLRKLQSRRMKAKHHFELFSAKAKERKLRIAASLNNVDTVEKLLRENVNPKVTDDKQRSPLHIAASKGYTDVVRLLLQYGADPNQKDAIGNTALHLAACTSHIPTVTLLLKAGTNVEQADNQGYSPLHLACSKLKLLQRDSNASSLQIKSQVQQVIDMMRTYLQRSGNIQEVELLSSFSNQLSLSDSRKDVEKDLQALLHSLQDLDLSKSKIS
ncbi:uncharacterized protein LOC143038437 isoform X2 [Oratosquilla oratoria]|uniref:uncharacterized protein LOC143038437 isoform X2 n=1 Tax=Oratosquilla oratoria TaxID=337810 RepID=UPI003F77009A